MEQVLIQLKKDFEVRQVETCPDGTVEVSCGRYVPRLDHFMCGKEKCRCERAEGWCEEVWEEECVEPLQRRVDAWAKEHASGPLGPLGLVVSSSVSEKGHLDIYLKEKKDKDADTKNAKNVDNADNAKDVKDGKDKNAKRVKIE